MTEYVTQRIYDHDDSGEGLRILVDRLWPRGISKERAALSAWEKELAPSADLRNWFDHRAERFEEFRLRYRSELDDNPLAAEKAREWADEPRVILLYSARDTQRNQATVLREWLGEADAGARGRSGSAPGSS